MEEFGERVRRLRTARKMGQRALAAAIGKSKTWVVHLETGQRWKGELPPGKDIAQIAQAFEITVAELTDGLLVASGEEQQQGTAQSQIAAPRAPYDPETAELAEIGRAVLRMIEERGTLTEKRILSAGRGTRRFPIENRVPASDASVRDSQLEDDIEIPDQLWEGARWPRVFYVSGDCMTGAGIVNGDHVIIDGAETNPRNGQIVIAQVNGGLTLKRFFRVGTHIELRPKAFGYDPIIVHRHEELLILGCLHNVYATGNRESEDE